MVSKIYAIIQARMNSTRLPGKIMKKIEGKPMLHYVINQTLHSKLVDDIIIATTRSKKDNPIVDYCKKNDHKYFRGSEDDVLDRYYQCSLKFSCDPIVRITSDCPLIDPNVIDKVITKFKKGNYDYIGNNITKKGKNWNNDECNFPQGMTVEISTFKALKKAWKEARKHSEREHVFPYIQFNPHIFKISNVKYHKNLSKIRCTVDRTEDLKFVREIYKRKPENKKFIVIQDIEKIVKSKPNLVLINNKIPFDEGYKKSVLKDKESGYE